MPRIRIHEELESKPTITEIPEGRFKLTYSASGPGEVVEQLSVSEKKPVRFLESGTVKRVLERNVTLSARPREKTRNVRVCRTKKQVTEEIFEITLVLKPVKGRRGSKRSSTVCGFTAKKSAETCPEPPEPPA